MAKEKKMFIKWAVQMNKVNSMIRLFQEDVFEKKENNWRELFEIAIDKINDSENVINVYACNNNIYDEHIKDMNNSIDTENIKVQKKK